MSASATPPVRQRVDAVVVVRGIIMILMALDHTRDDFGNAAASPTNLPTTTVPLFFTRWVTHFCAPTFFLLTGTGAYLARRRRSTGDLSRFLVSRGLWLISSICCTSSCCISSRPGATLVRFGSFAPAIDSPTPDRFPMTQPPGWPVSLPVVYLVWVAVVVAPYRSVGGTRR